MEKQDGADAVAGGFVWGSGTAGVTPARVRQSPGVLSVLCRGSPGPCRAKKARVRKVEERKGLARPLAGTGGRGLGPGPGKQEGRRGGRGQAAGRGGPGLDLCTEGRCRIPGQQEENTPEAQIPAPVIATIHLCGAFLFLGSFILALETPRSGTPPLPHLGVRTCPWTWPFPSGFLTLG